MLPNDAGYQHVTKANANFILICLYVIIYTKSKWSF